MRRSSCICSNPGTGVSWSTPGAMIRRRHTPIINRYRGLPNSILSQCLRRSTSIHSTHSPVTFKSGHFFGQHYDADISLVDACLATTATPIVLPLARFTMDGSLRTFIDGGLWANSPIVLSLIEALQINGDRPIEMISIGTCAPARGRYVPKGEGWGILQWRLGVGALEASLDSQSQAAKYALSFIAPHLRVPVSMVRFHQTAPSSQDGRLMGMDCAHPRSIDVMLELGRNDAEAIYAEVVDERGHLSYVRDIFADLPPVDA